MTTRAQRDQAIKETRLATRRAKEAQFETFMQLMWPACLASALSEDELLPAEYDVKMTAEELRIKYGKHCRDIFQLLFVRWSTKGNTRFGPRQPRWKLNPVIAKTFAEWMLDRVTSGVTTTPREALDFMKSTDAEQLRRVGIYTDAGHTNTFEIVSKEEHAALLETQRAIRKAWATRAFGVKPQTEVDFDSATYF